MPGALVEERWPIPGFPRDAVLVRSVRDGDLPYGLVRYVLPPDWDPDGHLRHDGEWEAQLPHERVSFEGHEIPAYDLERIDPERAEWERRRPDGP